MDGWAAVAGLYLSEVPNVKEVEGLKQFTLFEKKLCLTNSQKCPDILEAQELKADRRIHWLTLYNIKFSNIAWRDKQINKQQILPRGKETPYFTNCLPTIG